MIKLFIVLLQLSYIFGSEFTFMLDAKDDMCFYEDVKQYEETLLEYQVIEGGNLDVDVLLKSPSGKILYDESQKQYDSHTWNTTESGIYTWCFSNKFSTFTSKLIYFDFMVGDGDQAIPLSPGAGSNIAMTQLEVSAVAIHESLVVVSDYQTHFRLKESSGRAFAEDINTRVMMWSIGEFICIIAVMLCQVFTLRSFFSDKKNRNSPAST
ncbi:transmembrane emp24 domain-containing protein 7-like [Watersipora subatra]|uniref:transmembrane emp24 domain-containing protein 7-like n=1 Tax=Watersipora subatra TaxID=2589382 RepID=UPI00355C4026